MDFDARDDTRADDRFSAGRDRGGRGASSEHEDEHDWRQPDRQSRDRDEYARELGRGPGLNNRNDDSRDDLSEPDDRRWTERDQDPRGIDPREVFMKDLDLPRGLEREIVHDPRGREYTLRGSETRTLPRGREREIVRDRDREYTLRGSESRTLATVGAFRVVSSRDLRDHHDRPADPRSGDLRHLRQVYRAFEREAERLEVRGARIDRVILDYELKRDYQKWLHEHDRDRDDYDGHPDCDPHEIEEWAREHDVPYFDEHVHFPDARIEYEESDGRWDHLDVEVITVHYRGAHGSAAARSGFRCYGGSSARISGLSGGGGRHGGWAEEFWK